MYAPRRSAGASPATTDCDVGTHSISPMTNRKITSSTTGTAALTESSVNGTPMSGIATASFTHGEMCSTARVRRSWQNVTMSGLTMTSTPHAAGAKPYVVVSDTGSTTSKAT